MMKRQARWSGLVVGFVTHMIAGSRACSTFAQPIYPTTTSETSPHYAEALHRVDAGTGAERNAYAERWIRTVRAECLDWLLIIGQGHLERILRVYVGHYNQHRPHRALWLEPPDSSNPGIMAEDHLAQVHRRDLLGGLVHEYRRAA
jgi:hypothetical protein